MQKTRASGVQAQPTDCGCSSQSQRAMSTADPTARLLHRMCRPVKALVGSTTSFGAPQSWMAQERQPGEGSPARCVRSHPPADGASSLASCSPAVILFSLFSVRSPLRGRFTLCFATSSADIFATVALSTGVPSLLFHDPAQLASTDRHKCSGACVTAGQPRRLAANRRHSCPPPKQSSCGCQSCPCISGDTDL